MKTSLGEVWFGNPRRTLSEIVNSLVTANIVGLIECRSPGPNELRDPGYSTPADHNQRRRQYTLHPESRVM